MLYNMGSSFNLSIEKNLFMLKNKLIKNCSIACSIDGATLFFS